MGARHADERLGPRGVDRGGEPGGIGPGVHEHGDRAEMERPEKRHVEVDRHRNEEQHRVTGDHAPAAQASAEPGDARRELAEVEAARAAMPVLDDREPPGVTGGPLPEPRGDVGVLGRKRRGGGRRGPLGAHGVHW